MSSGGMSGLMSLVSGMLGRGCASVHSRS